MSDARSKSNYVGTRIEDVRPLPWLPFRCPARQQHESRNDVFSDRALRGSSWARPVCSEVPPPFNQLQPDCPSSQHGENQGGKREICHRMRGGIGPHVGHGGKERRGKTKHH